MQNLPIFDAGARILDAIAALSSRIETLWTSVEANSALHGSLTGYVENCEQLGFVSLGGDEDASRND
jgi:hypothetical protein